ncbi:MAG: DUF1002 domain-containing protein [Lachnospiraceae bacterium]|nr:DUF1002 domain-containing protein [Lachnospiraceae bacterium]
MRKTGLYMGVGLLAIAGLFEPADVRADAEMPFVALGADLNSEQKKTVLELLDISEEELENDHVISVTNADEHEYLDDYLSASVIGTRALSSVAVWERENGHGVQVTTHNISYCTTGMYQNALVTAGLENADVVVAGPFNLSGTAALVGAIKAYSEMNGQAIDPENIEVATEELVVTGELSESIGAQPAEELVGAVKDVIVAEEITDSAEIKNVITETAEKMEIQLSEEDSDKIAKLMEGIGKLDLDVDKLKEQAQGLYDKLSKLDLDLGVTKEQAQGFFAKLSDWFQSVVDKLAGLFR